MKYSKEELDGLSSFLSQGADERIFTDETGRIKYGISLVDTIVENRGSCTSNPATDDEIQLFLEILDRCKTTEQWLSVREKIRSVIKHNIFPEGRERFKIFYAPSGTDLLYYPILFAKLINPGKQVLNIVTCLEELGSGTGFASAGKYHAEYNQFGEKITKGGQISEYENIKTVFLKARSDQGEILENETLIESLVQEHKDHAIVINLVYGSKSGIESNLNIIDKIPGDNIIWNTDLCQFRHGREIIEKLLNKKSVIMITGSKFYQSPPFSGALLVPIEIYNRIDKSQYKDVVQPYGTVYSKFDFPRELWPYLPLPEYLNKSLTLRWLAAVNEINRFNQCDRDTARDKIQAWRNVNLSLMEVSDAFELMPHQNKTNKSIISFRLKVNGEYLKHEELKALHHAIATTDYTGRMPFQRVFIGQPVPYTNQSFLRLAIGAKNIRKFINDDEKIFPVDRGIIHAIIEQLTLRHGYSE